MDTLRIRDPLNREGSGIGVWMSGNTVIENCLIAKNTTTHAQTKGGGVYLTGSSVVRNCTITGNKAGNGGGVYTENGGTVENCIISDNQILATAGPGDPDWYHAGTAAIYRNNCTPVDVGTDCVTAAPNFIDAGGGDYRIASGSACVDAGIAVPGFDGITDFYGGARVSGDVIDIGAREVVRQGVGCGIATSTPHVPEGQPVTLESVVFGFSEGATLAYNWDFDGDGLPEASGVSVTRVFPAGYLTVGLKVTDGTSVAAVIATNLVLVSAADIHVLPVNPGASHPFNTWATAATNIQEAIDAGIEGSTVWIGDGIYHPASTLTLMRGMTVRGVHGPDTAIIDPSADTRIFLIAHPDAVLSRLTLTGGKFGVQIDRGGGTLSDLVISNNYYGAGGDGGAGIRMYAGTVRRCIVADNRQGLGSDTAGILISERIDAGDPPVLIENCLIVGNRSTSTSGYAGGIRAHQGTIRNCTIVGNVASNATYAGGLHTTSAVLVENCIVVDNVNQLAPDKANWVGTASSFRYTCTAPDPAGTQTFAADPRFVDPAARDFRLQGASPCINTGLTLEGMDTETDLSGDRRVRQRVVDLGALEYVLPKGSVLLLR